MKRIIIMCDKAENKLWGLTTLVALVHYTLAWDFSAKPQRLQIVVMLTI